MQMPKLLCSIRFLLACTASFAALMGWLIANRSVAQREEATLRRLSCEHWHTFDYQDWLGTQHPKGPSWIRSLLHEHLFDRVATIGLHSPNRSDIESITTLASLWHLSIADDTALQDLNQIQIHPSITSLEFANTSLSSLDGIEKFDKLWRLDLFYNSNLVDIDAALTISSLKRIQFRGCSETLARRIPELKRRHPETEFFVVD